MTRVAPIVGPEWVLTRRRFLQASLAVGGATALLPSWMQELRAAAAPLAAHEGVLVMIMMPGGNDGLNMVPPVANSAYYQLRPNVSISQAEALPIGHGLGLHPALTNVKRYFDNGKAAIVQGVGTPGIVDLSHFSSMARWMAGSTSVIDTGWVGRCGDALGGDSLFAVNIGDDMPGHLLGVSSRSTSLPLSIKGAFGVDQTYDWDRREFAAIREYATVATGLGRFGDELARMGRTTIDLGGRISGAYGAVESQSIPVQKMALAARLINLDVGIRVINVELADFDHHQGHLASHQSRMTELNDGLGAFFANLSMAYENRVAIMTFSEFGRRPSQNASGGTDHGTASNMLVIGNRVRGGLYGAQPSLTQLDATGNLVPAVSFMSTYATALDSWLGVESSGVLGGHFESLNFFDPVGDPLGGALGVGNGVGAGFIAAGLDPNADAFANPSASSGYWLATAAGTIYRFGNAPFVGNAGSGAAVAATVAAASRGGLYVARVDGEVQALGDATHRGDMSGVRLNRPIVGIAATATGNGYWLLGGDGGIFSFGDAKFFGSTGALRLNQPVVGMAATPSGGGYWLVASDGGIFAFGDAGFFGSTGDITLAQPIVGMAASASGHGYLFVARDGGVFCFGDAKFQGSLGATKLSAAIVGLAA